MNKKFIPIFILLAIFISNPLEVFAERLIANPTVFTPQTAPHSAKPKTVKKAVKRNLKLGMKGNDVLVLQKFLIKKASGPAAAALAKNKATGRFGELTKAALEEFQKVKGLTVDGIAGAKIRALYNKA
jgi:peptidoglycan hydrolase-like protein with peptidoglycan-binding domain